MSSKAKKAIKLEEKRIKELSKAKHKIILAYHLVGDSQIDISNPESGTGINQIEHYLSEMEELLVDAEESLTKVLNTIGVETSKEIRQIVSEEVEKYFERQVPDFE